MFILGLLPWQISRFCFAYKCKHNANTNYDTNISKNNRPCLLAPAAPLNVQPRLLQNQFVFYLK